MWLKFVIFSLFLCFISVFSQSLPELYPLEYGTYEFTEWAEDEQEGNYPPHMIFHQTKKQDPTLIDEMDSDWTLPYNYTSASRINGLGELGISFLNTALTQDNGKYLGAAVLGLNTTNRENIRVSWTGRTIQPNERMYAIALQYKYDSNAFKNSGIVYLTGDSPGHFTEFKDIVLPEECNNKDSVYLRWKYFFASNNQGARTELAIDNIIITSDPITSISDKKQDDNFIISHNHKLLDIRTSNKNNNIIFNAYIYNLSGQLLYASVFSDYARIDLNGYIKGIYFVKITNEECLQISKISIND